MGLMLASFTGNVDDQDNLAIVLVQGHFLSINILHLANANKTFMRHHQILKIITSFWLQAVSLQVSLHICKYLRISHLPALSSSPASHQNLPWSRRYCHPPLPSKLAQMYNFHFRLHGIVTFCPFMVQCEDSLGICGAKPCFRLHQRDIVRLVSASVPSRHVHFGCPNDIGCFACKNTLNSALLAALFSGVGPKLRFAPGSYEPDIQRLTGV